MKALLSHSPGGPETLEVGDIPSPEPGDGEVRIRVRACGINFPDSLIIEDKYQFRPDRPFAPGGEVAGDIDAVGTGVTGVKEGDRVLALCSWGGMAERALTTANRCVQIPANMPYDQAAGLIFTYGTSLHALKQRANLHSGETLLVLGAAGGVGLAAVELGRALGANVVAAVSSDEKLALAKSRGAHTGLIYPRGPFDKDGSRALATQFKEATQAGGADIIYDAVGGDYAEAALRCMAWNGRFLVIGFPAGIPRMPLNLALLKGCSIVGVFWGSFTDREPRANRENNEQLLSLYAEGKIKPHISQHYSLADAGKGIADLTERRAMGKIVVMID